MNPGFASARLTDGQLNAIIKKLGGHDIALRVLRGELRVKVEKWSDVWRDENGDPCFSVTTIHSSDAPEEDGRCEQANPPTE